jgi:hypothetical protein
MERSGKGSDCTSLIRSRMGINLVEGVSGDDSSADRLRI